MFVTRHTSIADPATVERLWSLYEAAYLEVAAHSPSHEMLYRVEFDDAIADPANRLWVLWDDTDPVAMTLIATNIDATRYLSRAYFDTHYPQHSTREAVHYIMWLVVHPGAVAKGAIVRLAREVLQREAADGALLVFDAPLVRQQGVTGGFAEMMERLARAFVGAAQVQHLGTQYYFAVDLAPLVTDSDDPVHRPASEPAGQVATPSA